MRLPALSSSARQLVRAAVTAGVLSLLWHQLDGAAALERLAGAEGGWLLLAFAILNVQTLLSALRWRLTARRLGQRFGVVHALAEYYLSQLVNQTLPGGMIGDAGRAVRGRHEAGLAAAAQAVVLERLAGQVTLFALMIAAVSVSLAGSGPVAWPDGTAATLGVALGVGGLAAALLAAAGCIAGRWGAWLRTFAGSARCAVLARDVWPSQLALSIGTVACNLAAFAACARATGTALPLGAVLTLVPMVLAMMLIPVSIGGWGLREGAAASLWPLIGNSAEAGLAASIAFGLMLLASGLPGLFPLVAGMRRSCRASPPDARHERRPRLPQAAQGLTFHDRAREFDI